MSIQILVIDDIINTEKTVDEVFLSIGSHIEKNGSIVDSIKNFFFSKNDLFLSNGIELLDPLPCQMFLRNPMSGTGTPSESDIPEISEVISKYNIHYYTHGPYIVNLSNPFTKKNPDSSEWVIGLLKKDLDFTSKIGGRGVVVHVGKSLKFDIDLALDKMEMYIRQVLSHATEECPLLLETAAGQGTELCRNLEDLSKFYDRFSIDDKKKFKICIDTCHIFAVGYDPLHFLIEWERLHPHSIGLVHFNDSKEECGSQKDRHSYYLQPGGKIGLKSLINVARWCLYHNIDMVTE